MNRAFAVLPLTAGLLLLGSAAGVAGVQFVTSEDIKNNTIQSEDVRDGALAQRDLNAAVSTKLNTDRRGITAVRTERSTIQFLPGTMTWVGNCGAGAIALGAGFRPIEEGQQATPTQVSNQPSETGLSRWEITLKGTAGYDVDVWVRCATLNG